MGKKSSKYIFLSCFLFFIPNRCTCFSKIGKECHRVQQLSFLYYRVRHIVCVWCAFERQPGHYSMNPLRSRIPKTVSSSEPLFSTKKGTLIKIPPDLSENIFFLDTAMRRRNINFKLIKNGKEVTAKIL